MAYLVDEAFQETFIFVHTTFAATAVMQIRPTLLAP
jgi:hypothetical protein